MEQMVTLRTAGKMTFVKVKKLPFIKKCLAGPEIESTRSVRLSV